MIDTRKEEAADIVERLEACRHGLFWPEARDAASEIATLRQQLEEAREALAQCEGALKAGGFEEGFAADACRKWRERYPA